MIESSLWWVKDSEKINCLLKFTEVLVFLLSIWCKSEFDIFASCFQQVIDIELIICWQAEKY
jgi:hypothetical protein